MLESEKDCNTTCQLQFTVNEITLPNLALLCPLIFVMWWLADMQKYAYICNCTDLKSFVKL